MESDLRRNKCTSAYMDVKITVMDIFIMIGMRENPVIELEDGLLPKIGKTRKTGTTVNFLPDDTIFEKTRFKAEEIKSRLHETAYRNPKRQYFLKIKGRIRRKDRIP